MYDAKAEMSESRDQDVVTVSRRDRDVQKMP